MAYKPGDPETVRREEGCPKCGERRMDYLEWVDDDEIECCSCGTVYRLPMPNQEDEE